MYVYIDVCVCLRRGTVCGGWGGGGEGNLD